MAPHYDLLRRSPRGDQGDRAFEIGTQLEGGALHARELRRLADAHDIAARGRQSPEPRLAARIRDGRSLEAGALVAQMDRNARERLRIAAVDDRDLQIGLCP